MQRRLTDDFYVQSYRRNLAVEAYTGRARVRAMIAGVVCALVIIAVALPIIFLRG